MPPALPTTPPRPVLPSTQAWALHSVAASRQIEAAALAGSAPHALMQQAGLMVARLAQALAPPQAGIWVAAGPGNNGGDGLVAARWLQAWGRQVSVSWLGHDDHLPDDARDALAQAQAAGVAIGRSLPDAAPLGWAIDALLGIGADRAPAPDIAAAIRLLNGGAAPVLAVDVPTGLCADSGRLLGPMAVRAAHTLSLLTLKPGLFTAQGRDHSGQVWLHGLGQPPGAAAPSAWLSGPPQTSLRRHAQHKGSFGDVRVLAGAAGMGGAALLAARAALSAGAGRVLLARLAGDALAVDAMWPELMPRSPDELLQPGPLAHATVVCGCGGGNAVADHLPQVLAHSARLVLDADALNAVAAHPALTAALGARAARGLATVLTPHPLEAARLLATDTAQVQAQRLDAAQALAERLACTVVLKGSGTVVAAPGRPPHINPSGNARLGTAGSGDVLAGWLGGAWSTQPAADPQGLAADTVWWHGAAAQRLDSPLPLRAAELIATMAATVAEAAAGRAAPR